MHAGEGFAILDGFHLVQPQTAGLGLVLADILGLGLDRLMHAVVAQVQVEGAVRWFPDQGDGPVGEIVRDVGAFGNGGVLESLDGPGAEVAAAPLAALKAAADVDVETVVFRVVAFAAEMPFADMPGTVAALLQCPRQCKFRGRQFLAVGGVDEAAAQRMHPSDGVDPVGDADARRVAARQDAGAGGGADGAGGVGLGEPHALRGQSVEGRGFVEVAAGAAEIPPAEVIDQNEENVGRSHEASGFRCGDALPRWSARPSPALAAG